MGDCRLTWMRVNRAWGPLRRRYACGVRSLIDQAAQRASDLRRHLLAIAAEPYGFILIQGVVEGPGGVEGKIEAAPPVHPEGPPDRSTPLPHAG
jgi:hypothetical protein